VPIPPRLQGAFLSADVPDLQTSGLISLVTPDQKQHCKRQKVVLGWPFRPGLLVPVWCHSRDPLPNEDRAVTSCHAVESMHVAQAVKLWSLPSSKSPRQPYPVQPPSLLRIISTVLYSTVLVPQIQPLHVRMRWLCSPTSRAPAHCSTPSPFSLLH
jgi:hypothetical protein